MKRLLMPVMGLLLGLGGCGGPPPEEVVLLVGREINPAWSSIYEPDLAKPGRRIAVIDAADGDPAAAVQAYLQPGGPRVVAVPVTLSVADPIALALQGLDEQDRLTVVPPPDGDQHVATLVAERALKLSQNRTQEGLFVVMDLPYGADPAEVEQTARRLERAISQTVDFRPTMVVVWEGPQSADKIKRIAKDVMKPIIVTCALNPGGLTQELKRHLTGMRYGLEADGVLRDLNYRAWLRDAVTKASLSAARP